jgi:hypothetical protein
MPRYSLLQGHHKLWYFLIRTKQQPGRKPWLTKREVPALIGQFYVWKE